MSNIIPFIPVAYQMRLRPGLVPTECVIINWIKIEAMPREAVERYPILHEIRGWRNRECYDAVAATDWTARIYQ